MMHLNRASHLLLRDARSDVLELTKLAQSENLLNNYQIL